MSSKKCSKCHQTLPIDQFGIISTRFRKNGSPVIKSRCKKCLSKDQSDWVDMRGAEYKDYRQDYESNWRYYNSEHLVSFENKRNTNRRKQWKKFMAKQKCNKCGIKDSRVLQWHHIDPSTKSFNIGSAIYSRNKSWQIIMQEIDKCECLCANCHFITHAELRDTKS